MKKGISLITLIVTIVVLLVLCGTVVLFLNNIGVIGKTNETKFKADLKSYDEEIRESIGSEFTHDSSIIKRVLYKKADVEKYSSGLANSEHMRYSYISEGVLTLNSYGLIKVYGEEKAKELINWAKEAKIKVDGDEEVIVSNTEIGTELSETEWTRNDVTLKIWLKDKSVNLDEKPYSFDNGSSWTDIATNVYTQNTTGILVKIRDEFGFVYTAPEINIGNIDKIQPKEPTQILDVKGLNTITVGASGATDEHSGLFGYKYSLSSSVDWENVETVEVGRNYTFGKLTPNSAVTVYCKSVDKVGNISSEIVTLSTNTIEPNSNITIKLSTEDWTKGPISANIECDNIPENYVLQYKLAEDANYKNGSVIPEISKNTTIYARLYYQEINNEIAYTEKIVDKIDLKAPSVPTSLEKISSTINTLTVKANGSIDNYDGTSGSGLYGYKYSVDGENWTDIIPKDNSHTFKELKSSTNYVVYVKSVDNVGNENADTFSSDEINTDEIEKVSIRLDPIEPIYEANETVVEIVDGTPVNVTRKILWCKKENATISHVQIPEGYELQYKLSSGTPTEFTTIENNTTIVLDYNCTVEARLYNKKIEDNAANNSEIVANIDNVSPSKPTNISVTSGINTLEVKAEGSSDSQSGLYGYKYSLSSNPDWNSIETIPNGETYTFEGIRENTQKAIYTKAVDNLGNISTEYYADAAKTDAITGTVSVELQYINGIPTYTDAQGKKWTKKINVKISYANIPTGYRLEYRIVRNGQASQSVPAENGFTFELDYNCEVDARLYNETLDDEAAVISKDINIIDNEAPTKPTNLSLDSQEATALIVSASGSSDAGSGLQKYQYSINNTKYWDTGKFNLAVGTEYTFYVIAIDNLGNVSEIYTKKYRTLYQYAISYNANTTDTVNNMPSSQTKTENVTLKLSSNIPTRTGYTFDGWATSANGDKAYEAGANYTSNSAVTLYAKWNANTYYIKYNANGGTGTMANSTHVYGTPSALRANTFEKVGCKFIGWSVAADSTTIAYSNQGNVTRATSTANGVYNLYAVWEPQTYTLTFNPCGGTVNPTSISQQYGTPLTLPTPNHSSYGYNVFKFLGWYTASSGGEKVGYTTMPAVNQTLYAQWATLTPLSLQYTAGCGSYYTSVSKPSSQSQLFTSLTLSASPASRISTSGVYYSTCGVASVQFTSVPSGTTFSMTNAMSGSTSSTSDYAVIRVYENDVRMVEWHQAVDGEVNLDYPTLYGPSSTISSSGNNISYKTTNDDAKVLITVTMENYYSNSYGYEEFSESVSVTINSISHPDHSATMVSGDTCRYPDE